MILKCYTFREFQYRTTYNRKEQVKWLTSRMLSKQKHCTFTFALVDYSWNAVKCFLLCQKGVSS